MTGTLAPPGAHVVLLPESGPPAVPLYGQSAENLEFFIQNVPPGEYRPFVWTGDDEIEYADPAVVRAKASAGERFRVDAGGRHEIKIEAKERK